MIGRHGVVAVVEPERANPADSGALSRPRPNATVAGQRVDPCGYRRIRQKPATSRRQGPALPRRVRRFCTCDQSSPNATLFISSHAQQPAKLNQKRRLERQFRLLEPKVDRGIPSRPPSRAYPNLPLVPVPLAPSRERTHGIGCVVARCAPRGLRRSPPAPPRGMISCVHMINPGLAK